MRLVEIMPKERLLFIDNIRIILIVLVILVHLAITYGSPVGDWYYQEFKAGMIESVIYVFFLAIIQSFFMGFFFLISGYFTPGSYDRKGGMPFFKDRVLRLGIPLLFYILFIDPFIVYALAMANGFTGNLLEFIGIYLYTYKGLATGPLWFIEVLLIFVFIYVIWRLMSKNTYREMKIPGNLAIAIFAFVLGIITFIVRIWFPIGWYFEPLHLQVPFFPQYIFMFIIGMIAFRGNWFMNISDYTGKLWARIAGILVAFFAVLLIMTLIVFPEKDVVLFFGGFNWQALTYALLEQFLGIAIIISLIVLFRNRFNNQERIAKDMTSSVYTVYILHTPIIILLALGLRGVILDPLLKFILVSPLAISVCFLICNYIRKLPIARGIL